MPNDNDQPRRASGGSLAPGTGGDYDPDAVQIRPAATVLILDERPDLQVLMLKRNARSVFVGDMWVFPGGAVDPEDATPEADALVDGLTDPDASAQLGFESGGIAFWVAALRETFEEAGILLARTPGAEALVDLSAPDTESRFQRHRDGVNDGSVDFIETVGAEGLHLDGRTVHYVSQWITPLGPPRRYDARFFVTAMPAGQQPLHDDDEAVDHQWVRPADAIAANETDEMVMMTPTISMLQRLARFTTVADAVASAAAATSADDEHVHIRFDVEGPQRIAWPGDDDYDDADDRIETGVVRWPG